MISLADRIQEAMGYMSNMDLSRLAGIPESTLRSYLPPNTSRPRPVNLRKIAEATGVHLHWLATGEGPMRPGDPIKVPGIVTPDGSIQRLSEARAFVEQVLMDDLRGIGEKARELTDEEVLALAASIHKTRETLG